MSALDRKVKSLQRRHSRAHVFFLVFILGVVLAAMIAVRYYIMEPVRVLDNSLYPKFKKNSIFPLVLALLSLAVSNFTACLQWKLLLEKQGVRLKYGKLLKLYQADQCRESSGVSVESIQSIRSDHKGRVYSCVL